jgi:hypothetical protein
MFFGIQDDGKSPEKFCEFCMKITVLWDVTPWNLVDHCRCLKGTYFPQPSGSLFLPEDRGSKDLAYYMASHHRKQQSS